MCCVNLCLCVGKWLQLLLDKTSCSDRRAPPPNQIVKQGSVKGGKSGGGEGVRKNKILCLLDSPVAGVLLFPFFKPRTVHVMSEKCRFLPRGLSLNPSPLKMMALPISQFAPTSSSLCMVATVFHTSWSSKTSRKSGGKSSLGHSTFM